LTKIIAAHIHSGQSAHLLFPFELCHLSPTSDLVGSLISGVDITTITITSILDPISPQ
jgi:hypothetical protein